MPEEIGQSGYGRDQRYMRATDTNPSVGSEWYVLGLARGGLSLKEKYFSTYYNHTANYIEEKKGILTNTSKYTEYSKRILVLTSEGKDAPQCGWLQSVSIYL